MGVTSGGCSCGAASHGRRGRAFNQEAFRYLLETERRRAERAGRPILLLLVGLKDTAKRTVPFADAGAEAVLCGLWACVREVDIVGWFREARIAGAILPQGPEPLPHDAPRLIGERTSRVLLCHLAAFAAPEIQVRVLQLRPKRRRD
jgi:hypothetical protein